MMAIATIAWNFLKGLPWQLYAVLGLILSLWWCYHLGYKASERDNEAKAAKVIEKIVYKQGKVTEKVITKYVDRVREVRIKGDTIIQKVTEYVTPENDLACTVNAGFVRLWDDSNQNAVSEATSGADAAPSEISLSDIGRQKAIEAKMQYETETQLEALQEWVREQGKVK